MIRFVADCHFGHLTRRLRLLGYDTLYFNAIDDDDLLVIAREEERVLLTRDRALSLRDTRRCCYIRSNRTEEQLHDVQAHFDLLADAAPFTRCMHCNTLLKPVDKAQIADQLPPKVRERFDTFMHCETCEQLYWKGDHYRKMEAFLASLAQSK